MVSDWRFMRNPSAKAGVDAHNVLWTDAFIASY